MSSIKTCSQEYTDLCRAVVPSASDLARYGIVAKEVEKKKVLAVVAKKRGRPAGSKNKSKV